MDKGKIYKIISSQTEDIYIGSTNQHYLSSRLAKHRYDGQKCSSYLITKYKDCKIILIENYPCNDINELRAREQYWIDKLNPINKRKAKGNKKEYDRLFMKNLRAYKKTWCSHNNCLLDIDVNLFL